MLDSSTAFTNTRACSINIFISREYTNFSSISSFSCYVFNLYCTIIDFTNFTIRVISKLNQNFQGKQTSKTKRPLCESTLLLKLPLLSGKLFPHFLLKKREVFVSHPSKIFLKAQIVAFKDNTRKPYL